MYFERLDTIRFYAVFAVIFAHIFKIWTWPETLSSLIPLGRVGVLVFFVLSGFLITTLLLTGPKDEPVARSFKNFYARRTLRIFPIYYLYLLVVFSMDLDGITAAGLYPWLYLTNIHIYQTDSWLLSNSHLWTLSVEEQFYIVWPFIVLFLRNNSRALYFLFSLIILSSIATRFYLIGSGHAWSPQVEVFTFACLDFLAAGGVLALLYVNKVPLRKYAIPAIVAGIAIYYLTFVTQPVLGTGIIFWPIGQVGITAVGIGVVLYAIHTPHKNSVFHNAVTIHLGKISYGLYLYHNPIIAYYDKIALFLGYQTDGGIIEKIILCLLFTITTAQLSFTLIERPLLRLKKRFSSHPPGAGLSRD